VWHFNRFERLEALARAPPDDGAFGVARTVERKANGFFERGLRKCVIGVAEVVANAA
jgi:hypothetical protein